MVQKIHQASIFGRIGSGIAKGLSEQLPKEIERNRLSAGLQQLEQEAPNLTPTQRFTRALTVPGLIDRPQAVQSLSELYRMEGQNKALENRANTNARISPTVSNKENIPTNQKNFQDQNFPPEPQRNKPSLTKISSLQEELRPYLPMNNEEILNLAGDLRAKDPGLYPDAATAVQAAKDIDKNNQLRSQALQNQGQAQRNVQGRIDKELTDRASGLGLNVPGGTENPDLVTIPSNVYNKIRDKALDAIDNGKMTEEEAASAYGDELDAIGRKYNAVKNLGSFSRIADSPKTYKDTIRSIREDFKKRDDLENFADTLVTNNGLSNDRAYYMAYEPKDYPKLNQELNKLPSLYVNEKGKNFPFNKIKNPFKNSTDKTLKVAPSLMQAMNESGGSPLAIKVALNAKGYDGDAWIEYLRDHRKELKFSSQDRQLDKPSSRIPTWGDFWLFTMAEQENILE